MDNQGILTDHCDHHSSIQAGDEPILARHLDLEPDMGNARSRRESSATTRLALTSSFEKVSSTRAGNGETYLVRMCRSR
jgi:hypothetical protein